MIRSIFAAIALLLLAGCASNPNSSSWGTETAGSQAQSHQTGEPGSGKNQTRNESSKRVFKPRFPHPSLAEIQEDDLWKRIRKGFVLPDLDNDRVAYYEKYFSRNSKYFATMLARAKWFLPYILTEIEKRELPTELALLPAVESAFITDAMSHSKASGLWQFIPSTGLIYDLEQNWWYDGRRDPVKSTQAALQFLGELEKRFSGNWFHAIAAYNAGGITLERAIAKQARKGESTHFNNLDLRRETRDYVPKLIAFRNIFLNPQHYNINLPPLSNAPRFASLDAGSQIDLNFFAKISNIDSATLRFLNSAYRRNVTPPSGPHIIYVPVNTLQYAKTKLASLSSEDRMHWARHRVKKGEVLGRIAASYQVSLTAIKQNNKLKSNVIHPGQILLIPAGGRAITSEKTAAASANGKLTHKVRRGDTLWDIAQRYGVKVAQISRWNQITHSQALQLGQKLTIYTRS